MEIEINSRKFEAKPHQTVLDNQKGKPYFDNNDIALIRDEKKCIGCGLCRTACLENNNLGIPVKQEVKGCFYFRPDGKLNVEESKCTRCGQCIMACPTATLTEKENIPQVLKDLQDPEKVVIAQTAPSMRVSIGEGFGLKAGEILEGQMVAALKQLGFDYVFDVNLGADFTTYEEVFDLMDRLNEGTGPMFTSCCPSRVKYIEDFHPNLIPNITSVRSPQQCLAVIIKTFFAKKNNIDPKKISVVSIMPCIAKKFESRREGEDKSGTWDVDWVLTTREIIKMLKEARVDLLNISPQNFDQPLGESSGAGVIYGAGGGVMESSVRSFVKIFGNQESEKIDWQDFRGMAGIKKASFKIREKTVNIAIATGLANAEKIIADIKNGVKYDYIEVMACPGGCVGGGGQPKPSTSEIINQRRQALYKIDANKKIRYAHENPVLQQIYKEFFGCAGSELAQKYLHTNYNKRQARICHI